MKYSGKYSSVIAVGTLILIVGAALVSNSQRFVQPNVPVIDLSSVVDTETIVSSGGHPAVAALAAEGDSSVTIADVTLEKPGFIVVRDDLFGKPAIIVGVSKLLVSGKVASVSVSLSRNPERPSRLYAFMYMDNGDGIFKQADDTPVINEDGTERMIRFAAGGDTPAVVVSF